MEPMGIVPNQTKIIMYSFENVMVQTTHLLVTAFEVLIHLPSRKQESIYSVSIDIQTGYMTQENIL